MLVMRRREFLTAAATAAFALGSRWARAAGKKPNFLWILSEDNSTHYMKLFDPHGAPAPNIERMAEQGVAFTRAFSNAPVCSVARSTLMTGCYAPRIGVQFHRKMKMATLPAGMRMWPAYLRDAGYYTTNNRKKDYNCVEGKGVWDKSGKTSWRDRPSKDTPFFHMQNIGTTHESSLHFKAAQLKDVKTDASKVFVPPIFPDTETFRYTLARYHDRVTTMDGQVQAFVQQLADDGLLEDTFIFYFGDNGGVLPGSKGYVYNTGLEVPLVVRIPANWKHLVPLKPGTRSEAFVSFVDFGPTLLHLAGVPVPESLDGVPFLGADISPEDLAKRDETYGYADRFDEKYDLVRTLRKGKMKYTRNYQPYFPPGLQNNYRYRMLAYQEWRSLYKAGKLNATQRFFFEPKPAEALYDVEADPYETKNLAGDPKHAETLADLRARLQAMVKGLPDLSLYPESYLMENALDDGAAFGQKHKAQIARLLDVADLNLLPFPKAKPGIEKALASKDRWERYWALTVCSGFADAAKPLVPEAKRLLKDEEPLVRVRAAEFLAIVKAEDPRPTLIDVLNTTTSVGVALIALNTVVFIQDHLEGYPFDVKALKMKAKQGEVGRRLEYLATGKG